MTYMQKFRASAANLWLQRLLRLLEFLSPVISLGFFAARLYKIAKLERRLTASNGAVAGILAAAIVYSFIAGLISCCVKAGPKFLRWLLMVMDLLFVGAFIGVAYLTRPHGGSSGPCTNQSRIYQGIIPKHQNCNLPWATFITAIISAILHFLTALFHEVKDRRNARNADKEAHGYNGTDGYNGTNGHNGGYAN
ncbi:hypothetical protein LTR36_007423 [Oleoguttula mirabilis]|uniref:MARVEL domain-containing protein n=1 Tax=Oleoguttula mirabilis TaxID=1507867 RepID=A0AAV9J9C1_9PEZI|nr:hypothetical protein LTR36_007423 [Oleoguttula mirabilis]